MSTASSVIRTFRYHCRRNQICRRRGSNLLESKWLRIRRKGLDTASKARARCLDGRPSPLALPDGLLDDDVLPLGPAMDAPVETHWSTLPFGLRLASGARFGRWRQGTAARFSRSIFIWFPPSPRHCHRPCLGACLCRCWCPCLCPLPLAEQSVRASPARPARAPRRSCSRCRKGHNQRRCHCPWPSWGDSKGW